MVLRVVPPNNVRRSLDGGQNDQPLALDPANPPPSPNVTPASVPRRVSARALPQPVAQPAQAPETAPEAAAPPAAVQPIQQLASPPSSAPTTEQIGWLAEQIGRKSLDDIAAELGLTREVVDATIAKYPALRAKVSTPAPAASPPRMLGAAPASAAPSMHPRIRAAIEVRIKEGWSDADITNTLHPTPEQLAEIRTALGIAAPVAAPEPTPSPAAEAPASPAPVVQAQAPGNGAHAPAVPAAGSSSQPRRLSMADRPQIAMLIAEGKDDAAIAASLGLREDSIARVRKEIEKAREQPASEPLPAAPPIVPEKQQPKVEPLSDGIAAMAPEEEAQAGAAYEQQKQIEEAAATLQQRERAVQRAPVVDRDLKPQNSPKPAERREIRVSPAMLAHVFRLIGRLEHETGIPGENLGPILASLATLFDREQIDPATFVAILKYGDLA